MSHTNEIFFHYFCGWLVGPHPIVALFQYGYAVDMGWVYMSVVSCFVVYCPAFCLNIAIPLLYTLPTGILFQVCLFVRPGCCLYAQLLLAFALYLNKNYII